MAYEQLEPRRPKVRYNDANDDNPLVYQLVEDGEKVTPTSATITIYERGNDTALVSGASMTVDGTLLTYSVDTTTTASWPIKTGYRGEMVITHSGGTTTPEVIVFDVVRYPLNTRIGWDQLVALDDNIRGDAHYTDEDFKPIIEACRTELQGMLETKLYEAERVNESWFVDSSLMSMVHRYLVLAQWWHNRGNEERRDYYNSKSENLFNMALNTYPLDSDQDGDETDSGTGIDSGRLIL